MNKHHLRPALDSQIRLNVTPESAGWTYLHFRVSALAAGEHQLERTEANEAALVPLGGRARLRVGEHRFDLARKSVFDEMPHVLYVPPGREIEIQAADDFEFAIGAAPAEGRYPLRLIRPAEMKQEVRGGGASTRQVNHILAPPLPAERLILYDVYVPGGMWSGYPPHCHDGYGGSPYLEEVYYYRIAPPAGFALHRNYRRDSDFDEVFTVRSGDLVLVTEGFHPVAAPPGANIYFLNYLAGELLDEDRATPPYDDPDWDWIKEDWAGRAMDLPVVSG